MTWSMRNPICGDIIRVEIKHKLHHYGIYISDTEIIQFGTAKDAFLLHTDEVCVNQTTIEEFLNKGFLEVREYSLLEKLKRRKKETICQNARNRIGEKGYDILSNNCEHFVNECVFGIHKSDEVSKYNMQVS